MLRWASFFSFSASLAVVGLASLRRASWIWTVPVEEVHLAPLASLDCCGTSLVGMPSRTPVPGSVTIFQPTLSCLRFAVSGWAGGCSGGRIGMVVTAFGLAPAVDGAVSCAWADVPATSNGVTNIN